LNILEPYGRSGYIGGIFGGSKAPSKTPVSVGEDFDVMRQRCKIKGCIVW
jgi:hypothetical protein